jgi:hypothetical protein
MCRLPYPMQGDSEAAFALRSHPSMARDVVAWLEDLSSGASRSWYQSNDTRLRFVGGMVSAQIQETIPPVGAESYPV